jgi:hypothetical protein
MFEWIASVVELRQFLESQGAHEYERQQVPRGYTEWHYEHITDGRIGLLQTVSEIIYFHQYKTSVGSAIWLGLSDAARLVVWWCDAPD